MVKKITDKQEKFIQAYLTNGYNATAAAIKAGYSEKTANAQAAKLMAKPLIKKQIDEVRKKEQDEFNFTRKDYFKIIKAMADGKLEETEKIEGMDRGKQTDKTHYKSLRKEGAQLLAKFFGFDAPQQMEHSHTVQIVSDIPDEIEDEEEEK